MDSLIGGMKLIDNVNQTLRDDLSNEMTQKAIAKECVEWIKRKGVFKSNVTQENMPGFIHTSGKSYAPITEFSTVDLGCERGNNAYSMIQKMDAPFSQEYS